MTTLLAPKKTRLPKPRLLTYQDYARLTPPDSSHYELRNGTIHHMPSPTVKHQDICLEIAFRLKLHASQHKLGKVIIAPIDVTFDERNTLQPDVVFVAEANLGIIAEKRVVGAPDLVVEVKPAGNTAAEMSQKKSIYESAGVREYWLVLPDKGVLRQYENVEGEFMLRHERQKTDTLQGFVPDGFSLSLADILP